MKRFQRSNGILFAVVLGFAGPSVLQGCGDSGSSPRKDAAVKLDSSGIHLDGGGLDGTVDRTPDLGPGTETAKPTPDTGTTDLPLGPEVPVIGVDTNPDQPPFSDIDVAKQPDLPAPIDGTPQADLPIPDAPLVDDTAPVNLDVATPDSPVLLIDSGIDVTVAALDAGVDITPAEAGAPGALTGWPTDTIDFGANPCGGEAPAATTFTLTNTGGTTVSLTKAKFTGTSGYSTDAAGKTIAAGASLVLTVHAPGVPQKANIPTTYNDVLTIETDIPNDDQHLIVVTQSAKGAILSWDTVAEFGSFGTLAPGFTTNAPFHVINMGNLAAAVTLSATGEFQVTSASPVTVGARSASDSVVTFVPSTGGAAVGTLSMSLGTSVALCQPLPAGLSLTGTSDNGAVALSAVSLSFATQCGGTAASQTLTVANSGTIAMNWTGVLEAGSNSMFQIAPASASLAAGGHTDVTVTPTVPTNATPITDTIDITSNAVGDTTHKVVLSQTPLGDVVSVVGGATIDLGSVPIVSPALTSDPVTVTLRNDANTNSAPAVVALQMTGQGASHFTVTPTQVTIPAGGQADVSVTFSPGTDPAIVTSGGRVQLTATLHWQVGSEANCGFASGNVTSNGTATLGQVSGIPGQLDFGLVNCGATGLQKQITITNAGHAAYQVTNITLVNSTYYAVDYPTLPRSLAPDGSMVITVTPSAIPATVNLVPDHSKYDGRLSVTTNILGDAAHDVELLMGAEGAIITSELSPTDWNFLTPATTGQTLKLYIPVMNTGNVTVTPELQNMLSAKAGVFALATQTDLPGGTDPSNITVLFHPTEAGTTYTATASLALTVPTGEVFCQPLPAGWNSTSRNIHMQGQSAAATH